MFQWAKMEA
jgi:hypothetical protein